MFLNKGKVNNSNILSRTTIEYMTSNHLGYNINRDTPLYLPGPGCGHLGLLQEKAMDYHHGGLKESISG